MNGKRSWGKGREWDGTGRNGRELWGICLKSVALLCVVDRATARGRGRGRAPVAMATPKHCVPDTETRRAADDDAASETAFVKEQHADQEAAAAVRLQHADEHPVAVQFRKRAGSVAPPRSQIGGIPQPEDAVGSTVHGGSCHRLYQVRFTFNLDWIPRNPAVSIDIFLSTRFGSNSIANRFVSFGNGEPMGRVVDWAVCVATEEDLTPALSRHFGYRRPSTAVSARGGESGWPRDRKAAAAAAAAAAVAAAAAAAAAAKEDAWRRAHSSRPSSSQSNWSTSADSELATMGSHDFETESSLDEKRSFAVFSSGSNDTRWLHCFSPVGLMSWLRIDIIDWRSSDGRWMIQSRVRLMMNRTVNWLIGCWPSATAAAIVVWTRRPVWTSGRPISRHRRHPRAGRTTILSTSSPWTRIAAIPVRRRQPHLGRQRFFFQSFSTDCFDFRPQTRLRWRQPGQRGPIGCRDAETGWISASASAIGAERRQVLRPESIARHDRRRRQQRPLH